MGYAKYLLWKTGLCPQWEPSVEDILYVAIKSHEVKCVVTPNGRKYYYVIPANKNVRYLYDLVRTFGANGVVLRPHKSYKYDSIVFRVPVRGQHFMRDVVRVNQDASNFGRVLAEHGVDVSNVNIQDMIRRIKQKHK